MRAPPAAAFISADLADGKWQAALQTLLVDTPASMAGAFLNGGAVAGYAGLLNAADSLLGTGIIANLLVVLPEMIGQALGF